MSKEWLLKPDTVGDIASILISRQGWKGASSGPSLGRGRTHPLNHTNRLLNETSKHAAPPERIID